MTDDNALRFVTHLARELSTGSIRLPSLPDVVVKIRRVLEQEDCDFDRVASAVSADPMLVSRLLVFANSAAYNVSGDKVESLDRAIQRLGFQLVRSTAIALALKQLFLGKQHRAVAQHVRSLWGRSMQLSALAHCIAARHKAVDAETAYICGLLHEVGKLYILTKAHEFPEFLGSGSAIQAVMDEWHAKIGKSILEAWGFAEDVCESANPSDYLNGHTHLDPTLADVMFVAERMLASDSDGQPNFSTMPSSVKLGIGNEDVNEVFSAYREKLGEVKETLSDVS